MTKPPCPACGQPIPDHATICVTCGGKLAEALDAVPALANDLEVTIARQSRAGDNGGRQGSSKPLVFALDPSIMRNSLKNTLIGWVRETCEQSRSMPWPPDDLTALALWLRRRLRWLRRHPAADELLDEITSCVDDCRRAVDRAPDRWYAGPCGCGSELYAVAGADYVSCTTRVVIVGGKARKRTGCGAQYGVEARRRWLLQASDDALAYPELAARALTSLGERVTPAMIRGYARRGRIVAHGHDERGHSLYRIGDVREVLAEVAAKRRDRVA